MSETDTGRQPEGSQPAGQRISAGSITIGVAWNLLATIVPQFLTLVLSLVVARVLGPAEQGVQSFIIFVAVTGSMALALGLPLSLQRTVSDRLGQGKVGEVDYALRWGQWMSLLPAGIAAALTLLVGQAFYTEYSEAWLLAACYAFFATIHSVSAQALLGLRQYRSASVVGLTLQLISVPVIIALLLGGHGVTAIVAVLAAASAVSAGATLYLLRRTVARQHLTGSVTAADKRSTRRLILTFAVGGGVLVLLDTVVNQRSELAFLAVFHEHEPEQIAYFSVAFAATQTAYRIPAALIPVVLPTVTALLAAGRREAVLRGYLQGQQLLLTLSSIGAGMLLGCGAPMITLLWGDAYEPAGRALLIMGVFPVMFGAMGAVANSTLLGAGKLRAVIIAQLGGASATLLLDLLLIRPFAMYGAAAANGLGMLISTACLIATASLTLKLVHPSALDIGRHVLLAAGISAPGLWGLVLVDQPGWQLLWGLAGGAAALALLYPLLRPLVLTERDSVDAFLRKLPVPITAWVRSGVRRTSSASDRVG